MEPLEGKGQHMTVADRLVIACPTCATLNRVPAARLADGGLWKMRELIVPGGTGRTELGQF